MHSTVAYGCWLASVLVVTSVYFTAGGPGLLLLASFNFAVWSAAMYCWEVTRRVTFYSLWIATVCLLVQSGHTALLLFRASFD